MLAGSDHPGADVRARETAVAARSGGAAPEVGVRKYGDGALREAVALRYALITRHRREFERRLVCRVLEVLPSDVAT